MNLIIDPLASREGTGHWKFDDQTFKSTTSRGRLPISVDPTGNGFITSVPDRNSKVLQCSTSGCMNFNGNTDMTCLK